MRQLVLALLAGGTGHGYDLKRSYDQNFGSIWTPTNDGQMYVTLSRLEKEGLVAHRVHEQEQRPDRKDFAITQTGRAALEVWLAEKPAPPNLRSETMLRILAAAISGIADHRVLITSARKEYRAALRRVEELRDAAEDPIRTLLVESASLQLDADLKWLDLADLHLAHYLPNRSRAPSPNDAAPDSTPDVTPGSNQDWSSAADSTTRPARPARPARPRA
jgi:DNA-binding PadR family transcriptional regulator